MAKVVLADTDTWEGEVAVRLVRPLDDGEQQTLAFVTIHTNPNEDLHIVVSRVEDDPSVMLTVI